MKPSDTSEAVSVPPADDNGNLSDYIAVDNVSEVGAMPPSAYSSSLGPSGSDISVPISSSDQFELTKLREDFKQLQDTEVARVQETESLRAEVHRLKAAAVTLQDQVATAETAQTQLRLQLADQRSTEARMQEIEDARVEAMSKVRELSEQLRKERAEWDAQSAAHQQTIAQLSSQSSAAEKEKLAVQALTEELDKLHVQLKTSVAERNELQEATADAEEEAGSLKKQLSDLKRSLDAVTQERDRLSGFENDARSYAQQAQQAQQQAQSLASSMETVNGSLKKAMEDLQAACREIDSQRVALDSKTKEIEALSSKITQIEQAHDSQLRAFNERLDSVTVSLGMKPSNTPPSIPKPELKFGPTPPGYSPVQPTGTRPPGWPSVGASQQPVQQPQLFGGHQQPTVQPSYYGSQPPGYSVGTVEPTGSTSYTTSGPLPSNFQYSGAPQSGYSTQSSHMPPNIFPYAQQPTATGPPNLGFSSQPYYPGPK